MNEVVLEIKFEGASGEYERREVIIELERE